MLSFSVAESVETSKRANVSVESAPLFPRSTWRRALTMEAPVRSRELRSNVKKLRTSGAPIEINVFPMR